MGDFILRKKCQEKNKEETRKIAAPRGPQGE